jgi:hypothetical protein
MFKPEPPPSWTYKNFTTYETYEIQRLVSTLRANNIFFTGVPNAGRRTVDEGKRLVAEGMTKGTPDLLIFTPPPAHPGASGTAIELKRPPHPAYTPAKASEAQLAFLGELEANNWKVNVCWGYDHAIWWLKSLGYVLRASDREPLGSTD